MRKLAVIALLMVATIARAEDDRCRSMIDEAKRTSAALTYRDFDQTDGKGWRSLADSCPIAAAELIEFYTTSKSDLTASQKVNLSFHAGQLYALGGNDAEAIKRFRLAVVNPAASPEFKWSEYVLATIAFLEHDAEALVRNRDLIADAGNDAPNQTNLKVVDRLIANFGRSYKEAMRNKK